MKRTALLFASFFVAMSAFSQSAPGYYIGKNFVSYNDSLMSGADVASFSVMAHGYAKDKNHVYHFGHVLEYANPATFTLSDNKNEEVTSEDKSSVLDIVLGTDESKNKYAIAGTSVTYDGTIVKKADAATFKYIGGEYAADKHHAYYKGKILGDAWGVGQFTYKGNGYATDGVRWYCNGKPVDRD